jgi:flagellar biosynthesis protein FlhG
MVRQRKTAIELEKVKTDMSARVITVASGKGGVGKSNFVLNMAVQMRKLNKRVAIIDADFGLANIEILAGSHPKYTVANVISGEVNMETALTPGPLGCMFLSGGSGLASDAELNDRQLSMLINGFIRLDDLADYILIDTRAGLSSAVINFIKAADETVIITTPDPTAIADAYALIKTVKGAVLKGAVSEPPTFKLVVNCVESEEEATEVYEKLSSVCASFLGIKLLSLGNIPYDPYLVRGVKRQQPVSILFPQAGSAQSYESICASLLDVQVIAKERNIQSFVLKLIGRLGS